LHAELNLADKNFKKTKKIHWIAKDESSTFEAALVELDHLITKKKIEEDDNIEDIVNKNSYIAYAAIVEGNMRNVKKGDVIQLERRGYFYVDQLESGGKMTLNFVPDGKSKNISKIQHKLKANELAKGKGAGKNDGKDGS